MEYLIGALVLIGLIAAAYVVNLKGKAVNADRDRNDLVSEHERRDKVERVDAERDEDHRTGDRRSIRDRLRGLLRQSGDGGGASGTEGEP